MFALTMEDLSHLGGRMGTEYTTTSSPRYFKTLEAAQDTAQKHYSSRMGAGGVPSTNILKWMPERKREDHEGLRTKDLGWIMYHIEPVKAER